jgi:uncharacterized protein
MFFYDSSIIILIPALLLSLWAQAKVKSTYGRYKEVKSSMGFTGADAARSLLDSNGLSDVPIEVIPGSLTDHYDPSTRVMRLSNDVYYSNSIAAIGVAAHETGHAIQDKERYAPLKFRILMVPAVNFGQSFSWILFIIGIFMKSPSLINFGIILFSAVVLFQIVTLPVEFDASRRAIKILEGNGILVGDEVYGAKRVLSAAALTYVAAALTAVAQLLRLLVISNNRRN